MKFLSVLPIFLVISMCNCILIDKEWNDFKLKFQREFQNVSHELQRKLVFESNLGIIENHNILYDKGLSGYKMGINKFADLTFEEFSSKVLMSTDTTTYNRRELVTSISNPS